MCNDKATNTASGPAEWQPPVIDLTRPINLPLIQEYVAATHRLIELEREQRERYEAYNQVEKDLDNHRRMHRELHGALARLNGIDPNISRGPDSLLNHAVRRALRDLGTALGGGDAAADALPSFEEMPF